MNKNIVLATVLAGGVLPVLSSAKETGMGLSARVGAAFSFNRPTVKVAGKDVRNNQVNVAGGLEYVIGKLDMGGEPGQSASYSLSADYYGSSNWRNIPVLLNFRGKMDQFEYSAGVGIGFGRAYDKKKLDFNNKTAVAFQLSGRYYFQKSSENPIFGEVRYYGSSVSELNSVAAMVGISF